MKRVRGTRDKRYEMKDTKETSDREMRKGGEHKWQENNKEYWKE
jgi:hypothetical protein